MPLMDAMAAIAAGASGEVVAQARVRAKEKAAGRTPPPNRLIAVGVG
jgi:hypothetical protein